MSDRGNSQLFSVFRLYLKWDALHLCEDIDYSVMSANQDNMDCLYRSVADNLRLLGHDKSVKLKESDDRYLRIDNSVERFVQRALRSWEDT